MIKKHLTRQLYLSIIFMAASAGFIVNPVAAFQKDPPEIIEAEITDEMEVLDTGPVHEAYAETASSDTEPGIVVPKSPPDPINEVPPEQEDLEEGVQWIPGYWAWDDDRDDFIWISGTWRVPPPGREWTPGRWVEVEDGYQWISGYWADSEVAENKYLPEPPDSLEQGPNMSAPSQDYAWVPGSWIWVRGYYAWQPGYWSMAQPDWVWVPAYYVWTPHGYISAGGYWDYPIIRRGVLFAPVYFYPRVHHRVGFIFQPGFIVGINVFSDCFFVRPHYRHYYFGNYYATRYYSRGIYPWFSRHARTHGYDPIYRHQRYTHRHDRNWENNLQAKFKKQRAYDDKGYRNIKSGNKENKHANGKAIVNTKDKQWTHKYVAKKKNQHKNGKSIINTKDKQQPQRSVLKNKDKKNDKQKVGKKELNKGQFQNHDTPRYKQRQKELEEPIQVKRETKKQKNKNVKPPENETAYKKDKKRQIEDPSYKNHRAPEPYQEAVPEQTMLNKTPLKKKEKRQEQVVQNPQTVDQEPEYSGREKQYFNKTNQQTTQNKKSYGNGRSSDNSARDTYNRQWNRYGRGR